MRPFRFEAIAGRFKSTSDWQASARLVEQLGFAALHLGDHLGQASPLPALVSAADATTRLRLGTRVINAGLTNAVRLAHDAATVDLLTGGRFELGVGAAWNRAEFTAAGYPWRPLPARAEQLDTLLREVRALWADPQVADPMSPAHLLVQRPHPPITVGGQSDAVLSVAARHADAVELTGAVLVAGGYRIHGIGRADVSERIRYLRRVSGDRFMRIELGLRVHTVVIGVPASMAARGLAALQGVTAEAILDSPFALVGTVEEVVAKILSVREHTGITRFAVDVGVAEDLAPVVARLISYNE